MPVKVVMYFFMYTFPQFSPWAKSNEASQGQQEVPEAPHPERENGLSPFSHVAVAG
jgi:hypothetical protein